MINNLRYVNPLVVVVNFPLFHNDLSQALVSLICNSYCTERKVESMSAFFWLIGGFSYKELNNPRSPFQLLDSMSCHGNIKDHTWTHAEKAFVKTQVLTLIMHMWKPKSCDNSDGFCMMMINWVTIYISSTEKCLFASTWAYKYHIEGASYNTISIFTSSSHVVVLHENHLEAALLKILDK